MILGAWGIQRVQRLDELRFAQDGRQHFVVLHKHRWSFGVVGLASGLWSRGSSLKLCDLVLPEA